jgi:hypothetical protein
MPIKPNYKTLMIQYTIYILAFIGASCLLFSLIIPFLKDNYKPIHHRITELYQYQIDPYNLIISVFFGFLGIYIAYQANLIAQRTLEQNRPKIILKDPSIKNGENSITVFNDGNFEAKNLNIFYKNHQNSKIKEISYKDIYISPASGIKLFFENGEDQAIIIIYQNAQTDKVYLFGGLAILDREFVVSFSSSSAITNEQFIEFLKFSKNKSYYAVKQWILNFLD